MTVSRRTFLQLGGVGAIASLAGCSALSPSPEGSPDLVFVNQTENPVTIKATVTNDADDTLVSTQLEVPVVEGHGRPNATIENVFESDGQYTVTVDVTDGPSATETLDVTGTEDDSDTHQVYLDGDEITFS
ncbi:hypothetical protein U3A55_13130 [Salarchaeum sp. III]|uniref:hypothetical protein n=1 Tax=Salarchaeum sp. III TaxID=3107927 RepID=UPI002ED934F2